MEFVRYTNIENYAKEYQFAVVTPEVSNSFYSDMYAGGARDFSFISEELPRVMERLFPISRKREEHFVAGTSMGAQGAFKWALRRPDYFAAAAGLSGVSNYEHVHREIEKLGMTVINFEDCFGDIGQFDTSENNLEYLAKKAMADHVDLPRLYTCMGLQDGGREHTLSYVRMAREIGLPLTFEEGDGGHDFFYWETCIPRVLEWFGLMKKNAQEGGM